MKKTLCTALALFLLAASALGAQDYYVRASSPAGRDGSSWANAFHELPTTLVRGATYWVASGDYNGYTFDDPESGSAYITIKKATDASHGPATDWDSSYGTGQARFTRSGDSVIVFVTGHYIIDGQTGGGPSRWTYGHGFKFYLSAAGHIVEFRGPNWWKDPMPDYVTLKHIEIQHMGLDLDVGWSSGIFHHWQGGFNNSLGSNNVSISYCYLHDFPNGAQPLTTWECQNWTFEYNCVARNSSSEAQHSEGWQDFGSDNMTVRYNYWEDIEGTGFIALKRNNLQKSENWSVYGNVFAYSYNSTRGGISNGTFCDARPDALIGQAEWDANDCSGMRFYNNTIIRVPGYNSGMTFQVGSGNYAYNNLWYDCRRGGSLAGGSAWLLGSTITEGSNTFINSRYSSQSLGAGDYDRTGDPFIDSINGDYRLATRTDTGISLPAPYDTDVMGINRDSSAVWDRGAYAFTGIMPLLPPTGLKVKGQ